ncbi:HNH endonuclease signature motif containing protein [Nakamurella alba]|uniref:HNH endonuclease signature motif containing protein n=1 Tax=Nakamurella alba TaxID=2665158 RepID=UPI0018AA315B|nr:HNH endonuclease signature motif containing protein [Nakamurella alba]
MDGARTGWTDPDEASRLAGIATDALRDLGAGAFWKLTPEQLDDLARAVEQATRLAFTVQVAVAGEYESQHVARTRGCSSTASMLSGLLRIGIGEARHRCRVAALTLPQDLPSGGETDPELPLLAAALKGGEISSEHARIIEGCFRRLPEVVPAESRAGFEEALVGLSKQADPGALSTLATHLQSLLEQEIPPEDKPNPKDREELTIGVRDHASGLTPFKGRLDDYGTEQLRNLFDTLARPRPAGDIPDPRSAPTRNAHALSEALDRLQRCHCDDDEGGYGGPVLEIMLDWDLLRQQVTDPATTAHGFTFSIEETRRLLCDANVLPVVMNGRSVPLDLGRTQRVANRALRRALAARDGGCAFPGCDRVPAWCHAHHINYWGRDLGATDLANCVLLCAHHHSVIHQEHWIVRMNPDDERPDFIPPAWLDPDRQPLRNTLHRPWRQAAPDDNRSASPPNGDDPDGGP